jgi:hypothetical protein
VASAQVQPGAQNGAASAGQQHVTRPKNGGATRGMHAQGENRNNQAKHQGVTNRTAQNAHQGTQHNGKGAGPTAQIGNQTKTNGPANQSTARTATKHNNRQAQNANRSYAQRGRQ